MRNVKWVEIEERVEHSRNIPAAYHRLVCQLSAEVSNVDVDAHSDHEVVRRCIYALQVLDAFAVELYSTRMTPAFRSKVLTPILQRQLRGLPDYYTPSTVLGIASDKAKVTIRDATAFYLREDPTLPQWIPSYRRNLIFVPDMLWHLGVVLGKIQVGDKIAHGKIRAHHDIVLKAVRAQVASKGRYELTPGFTNAEVAVIVEEELEVYFAPELALSVRTVSTPCQQLLTSWIGSESS